MFRKTIQFCFFLLFFLACGNEQKLDACVDIYCGENGICLDGICDCQDGYYGIICETLIQDKFIGTWTGIDCEGENFIVNFEAGNNLLGLTLDNYQIEIIDENNFNIIDLEFTLSEKLYVSGGSGKLLEDGTLEFTATLSVDGVELPACIIIMTKN